MIRLTQVVPSRQRSLQIVFAASLLAACGDTRLGPEKIGQEEQAWLTAGPNALVTSLRYAWDPSVAYQIAAPAQPEGRRSFGRYLAAYSIVPEATFATARDEIGWSTSDDYGTSDHGWIGHAPTNAAALPVARPSKQRSTPSDCPNQGVDDERCEWGLYSQAPVALAGPEPNTFVMVAAIASRGSTVPNDVAFVVSKNNGDSFVDQAEHVSTAITYPGANGEWLYGDTGSTGGRVSYLDATTTDGGKRLWVYWQLKAIKDRAYMRVFEWKNGRYVPDEKLPEPFQAPGRRHGQNSGMGVGRPRLLVDKIRSNSQPAVLGDYRVLLVGAEIATLYADVTSYTPISEPDPDDRDEDLCPTKWLAAGVRYRVAAGDVSAGNYWKAGVVIDETAPQAPLPLCIGDGRRTIAKALGYGVNPLARLHFRPSAAIVPANAYDEVTQYETRLEVAYVKADASAAPNEPGETYAVARRIRVLWNGYPPATGNQPWTQWQPDGEPWRDPSRPATGTSLYSKRLFDQWNPTLAAIPTATGYEAMLIWQDAREGNTAKTNGRWRYAVTRAASRNSAGGWALASNALGPASTPSTADDLATTPPHAPPWPLLSPLGHTLGIVGQTRTGRFMSVWPDNRNGLGNMCNPSPTYSLMSAAADAN